MPRRKKPQNKKTWHWYAGTVLNIFVALSMVLGTVVLFTGGANVFSQPRGVVLPTDVPGSDSLPLGIPTLAPTVGAPISSPVITPATTPTPSP